MASDHTEQMGAVMCVIASHQIVTTQHADYVIGHVIVATLKMETAVSVIITLLTVLLDNMPLVIRATHVALSHQTDTIQLLDHVIGTVIVDTTNRAIAVSVITTITTSTTVLSENIK